MNGTSNSRNMNQMPKQLGLKQNVGWALTGNIIYEGCQWLNLVILAKLLDVSDVGRFAFAMAICTPITIFSALRLRQVQVTDISNKYRFGSFLAVQLAMSAAALFVIATIAVFFKPLRENAALIIFVALGQAVIVNRDVFIAFNMKQERMDAVTVSKVFLGVSSVVAMGIVIWFTRNLLFGVIAMQVSKLMVLLLWDLRATARLVRMYTAERPVDYLKPLFDVYVMRSLIWFALPLGLTAILASLFSNIPRYLIQFFMPLEMLGYFVAIFSLVEAGHLVAQAAGLSALPRLSRCYVENKPAFLQLLLQLSGLGAIVGFVGVIGAIVGGEVILTIVFTKEYALFRSLFVLFMVYGTFAYICLFLQYGMVAAHRFRVQPILYLVAVLVVVGVGLKLIPLYGLTGAVWSLIAGKITLVLGSIYVITSALCASRKEKHNSNVSAGDSSLRSSISSVPS